MVWIVSYTLQRSNADAAPSGDSRSFTRLRDSRGGQRDDVARSQRVHMIRPLLQPGPRLGVVAMLVVDGAYRTIDVVEDAVLHDARAAELCQSGRDRAAEIMHGPRHLDRILRRLVAVPLPRIVLGKAQDFLRHVSATPRGREHIHLIHSLAGLQ